MKKFSLALCSSKLAMDQAQTIEINQVINLGNTLNR